MPVFDPDQESDSRATGLPVNELWKLELSRLPACTSSRERSQIESEAKRRGCMGFRSPLSHLADVVSEYLAGRPIYGPRGTSQSGG